MNIKSRPARKFIKIVNIHIINIVANDNIQNTSCKRPISNNNTQITLYTTTSVS